MWHGCVDVLDQGELSNPRDVSEDDAKEDTLTPIEHALFRWMIIHMFPKFKESEEFVEYQNTRKSSYNRVHINDFELGKVLGGGGFGVVCKCLKISTGKQYAVKIQSKSALLKLHKAKPERILMERRIYSHLNFPFIISLQYAFQSPSLVFIVMDLIQGGDLQIAMRNAGGYFREDRAKFYVSEIILGLHHLHINGILYRDLKPANVLLDREGHICLADMGLAAEFSGNLWASQSSRTGSFSIPEVAEKMDESLLTEEQVHDQALINKTACGTPMYQAPEMLAAYVRKMPYGPSIDIWSLGVMMFHFLSGDWPFDIDHWVEAMKSIRSSTGKKRVFESMINEMSQPVEFFKLAAKCSDSCLNLMAMLLQFHVEQRIGCSVSGKGLKEIMAHPFFKTTNWSRLLAKDIDAPYIPKIKERELSSRRLSMSSSSNLTSERKMEDIIKGYLKKGKGSSSGKSSPEERYAEWMTVPDEEGQVPFNEWDVVSKATLLDELRTSKIQSMLNTTGKNNSTLTKKSPGA